MHSFTNGTVRLWPSGGWVSRSPLTFWGGIHRNINSFSQRFGVLQCFCLPLNKCQVPCRQWPGLSGWSVLYAGGGGS